MTVAAAAGILILLATWSAVRASMSVQRDRITSAITETPAGSSRRGSWWAGRGARIVLRVSAAATAGLVTWRIGGAPLAAVALVIVIGAPRRLKARRARARREASEEQLASTVAALAAALRAGLSRSQALRFAAAECSGPLGSELRVMMVQEDVGVPLDVSLRRWGEASPSEDERLLANVMRLRIGAGLPAVLDELRGTLRSRHAARREIRSLSAQARLSGAILGALPIAFFVFLSLVSRHDMAAAYGTPAGVAAIVAGLALEAGAFAWIRRLVALEAA
jgi:tight adherence protein B